MSNIFPEDKKWFDGQPSIKKVFLACVAVTGIVLLDNVVQTGMNLTIDENTVESFWFYVRAILFVSIPAGALLLVVFIAIGDLFPDFKDDTWN